MGYSDDYYYDNASTVSGRTARSVRSKKPKVGVVVKKRPSRSQERERERRRRDEDDYERERERERRRRRHSDRSRSRSRDHAPSLGEAAASLVGDVLGENFGSSKSSRGGGGGSGGGGGGGGWGDIKHLLGFGDHSRSSWQGGLSSYYKRLPRNNLVRRTVKKIKKLLAQLAEYAKTHPAKVFALVIVPLLTGGALTAMLARVGLRLPHSVERLVAIASRVASGDSAGLVADAVRMVSGDGGRSVAVARGARAGDYSWQRREVHQAFRSDSSGGGWTETLRRVTKTLF